MRWALVLLAGCARFVDERPAAERAVDLAPADLARPADDGAPADLADMVIARGSFSGRAGHSGAGGVSLVRAGDGSIALVMAEDFAVTGVPGPEVVLTSRDTIGTRLDPAVDLDLGPLRSPTGAQRYPAADDGRRWAFVFCKPFGIEVARAELSP